MATWVLVYFFSVPGNTYFNNPVIMDSFVNRQQCEITLDYLKRSHAEVGITGNGNCLGEQKND